MLQEKAYIEVYSIIEAGLCLSPFIAIICHGSAKNKKHITNQELPSQWEKNILNTYTVYSQKFNSFSYKVTVTIEKRVIYCKCYTLHYVLLMSCFLDNKTEGSFSNSQYYVLLE